MYAGTTVLNATAQQIITKIQPHLKPNKEAAIMGHISGENGSDQMERSTIPKTDEIVGGTSQITILTVQQSYLTFPRVKIT